MTNAATTAPRNTGNQAKTIGSAHDDLPIVDAHHHYWDLSLGKHPWLVGEPIPNHRYGDYRAICSTFLPADYRRAAGGQRIVGNVYVEAEWDPADPLGETRWVHAIAEREGTPHAMVAQAWLDRDDAGALLAAQAAFPLVRAVRHKPRHFRQPRRLAARPWPARLNAVPPFPRRLCPPRRSRPAFRTADAVLASAGRRRPCPRLPAYSDRRQPHRCAGETGSRRHSRAGTRQWRRSPSVRT